MFTLITRRGEKANEIEVCEYDDGEEEDDDARIVGVEKNVL